MKNALLVLTICFFAGCNRTPPAPEVTQSEAPAPEAAVVETTPAPEKTRPSPSAKREAQAAISKVEDPLPSVEFTDDGYRIVYSAKHFSRVTEDGIAGYPPGTKLALVDEKDAMLVVRDKGNAIFETARENIEVDTAAGVQLAAEDRQAVRAANKAMATLPLAPVSVAPPTPTPPSSVNRPPPPRLAPSAPAATPAPKKGPQCAIKHYHRVYHRSVTGQLYRCPSGVSK